jgi:hypothetical protein
VQNLLEYGECFYLTNIMRSSARVLTITNMANTRVLVKSDKKKLCSEYLYKGKLLVELRNYQFIVLECVTFQAFEEDYVIPRISFLVFGSTIFIHSFRNLLQRTRLETEEARRLLSSSCVSDI